MVDLFIETNIQPKVMNTTTVIPCTRTSLRELSIGKTLEQILIPHSLPHGSCIYHLGRDICFADCNYYDSLRARFREGVGY